MMNTTEQYGNNEGATNYILSSATKKRGHKFFGCWCDMRRAVIIVNVLSICIASSELSWAILIAKPRLYSTTYYDDDTKENEYKYYPEEHNPGLVAVLSVVLFANLCGISGALSYNAWLVGLSLTAHATRFLFDIVEYNRYSYLMLLSVLFVYPHVPFIMELKKGTMSEENYSNEEYSCCCCI